MIQKVHIHHAVCAAITMVIGAVPTFSQVSNSANAYIQHNLVSDIPGMADFTDSHLVNPWGISESASSPLWISNQGTASATVYNGSGVASATVVTVPTGATKSSLTGPTGQVQNGSTGFLLANGKAASFIFATQDGTISAWNGTSPSTIMVDNSSAGAVYTGLAINIAGPTLYAANFNSGKVDVFDTQFHAATASGGFTDPNLPGGFAPYNIWNLGGKLYVTYAKQNALKNQPTVAAGNGVVDVFDTNGNLLQRVAANGPLNAPWGVAIAPSTFGAFGGALLVGNFGDGTINAFNLTSGNSLGALQDQTGKSISISGLWALLFGNGKSGGDPNTLYFTAGIQGELHGLLGSIAPPAAVLSLSNGASLLPGSSIAPGEVVLINGLTIGPSPLVAAAIPAAGSVATTLSTTSVTFNGTPAPILFASASQTSVVVPYEVAGATTASIVVAYRGQATAAFSAPVVSSAPALFTLGETGTGEVVALNQDGTVNGTANAAARGSAVLLYGTGDGVVDPPGQDGVITGDFIHAPALPVSVTIGGQAAQVLIAGSAPGFIAGVLQVEVIVPSSASAGPAPVVLTVGSASSAAGTTIVLK